MLKWTRELGSHSAELGSFTYTATYDRHARLWLLVVRHQWVNAGFVHSVRLAGTSSTTLASCKSYAARHARDNIDFS